MMQQKSDYLGNKSYMTSEVISESNLSQESEREFDRLKEELLKKML